MWTDSFFPAILLFLIAECDSSTAQEKSSKSESFTSSTLNSSSGVSTPIFQAYEDEFMYYYTYYTVYNEVLHELGQKGNDDGDDENSKSTSEAKHNATETASTKDGIGDEDYIKSPEGNDKETFGKINHTTDLVTPNMNYSVIDWATLFKLLRFKENDSNIDENTTKKKEGKRIIEKGIPLGKGRASDSSIAKDISGATTGARVGRAEVKIDSTNTTTTDASGGVTGSTAAAALGGTAARKSGSTDEGITRGVDEAGAASSSAIGAVKGGGEAKSGARTDSTGAKTGTGNDVTVGTEAAAGGSGTAAPASANSADANVAGGEQGLSNLIQGVQMASLMGGVESLIENPFALRLIFGSQTKGNTGDLLNPLLLTGGSESLQEYPLLISLMNGKAGTLAGSNMLQSLLLGKAGGIENLQENPSFLLSILGGAGKLNGGKVLANSFALGSKISMEDAMNNPFFLSQFLSEATSSTSTNATAGTARALNTGNTNALLQAMLIGGGTVSNSPLMAIALSRAISGDRSRRGNDLLTALMLSEGGEEIIKNPLLLSSLLLGSKASANAAASSAGSVASAGSSTGASRNLLTALLLSDGGRDAIMANLVMFHQLLGGSARGLDAVRSSSASSRSLNMLKIMLLTGNGENLMKSPMLLAHLLSANPNNNTSGSASNSATAFSASKLLETIALTGGIERIKENPLLMSQVLKSGSGEGGGILSLPTMSEDSLNNPLVLQSLLSGDTSSFNNSISATVRLLQALAISGRWEDLVKNPLLISHLLGSPTGSASSSSGAISASAIYGDKVNLLQRVLFSGGMEDLVENPLLMNQLMSSSARAAADVGTGATGSVDAIIGGLIQASINGNGDVLRNPLTYGGSSLGPMGLMGEYESLFENPAFLTALTAEIDSPYTKGRATSSAGMLRSLVMSRESEGLFDNPYFLNHILTSGRANGNAAADIGAPAVRNAAAQGAAVINGNSATGTVVGSSAAAGEIGMNGNMEALMNPYLKSQYLPGAGSHVSATFPAPAPGISTSSISGTLSGGNGNILQQLLMHGVMD